MLDTSCYHRDERQRILRGNKFEQQLWGYDDGLKVAHHSLAGRVADVHGQLHGDRHGGDDQAVPQKQQDVDGHLDVKLQSFILTVVCFFQPETLTAASEPN